MSEETRNVPATRSWRDIPQPVKPRAMSRGGRWRRWRAIAGTTALLALLGGLAAGGWLIVAALQENSPQMPDIAKTVAIRAPELRTTRDGVLDDAWLARTLALPPRVSLMELDLEKLRARVLADGQVLTASLTRQFPDRLIVHVTERTPLARLRIEHAGQPCDFLVARDGVVFAGHGFDPVLLDSLPWLAGVKLATDGGGFRPIARMNMVAQLLTDAQLAAGHLYRTWRIVSLERLDSDDEFEVTTSDHTTIVFSAKGGFIVQLANLDYMMEKLARLPPARARIDLSLGREVPVRIEPLTAALAPVPKAAGGSAPITLFPLSQSPAKREL